MVRAVTAVAANVVVGDVVVKVAPAKLAITLILVTVVTPTTLAVAAGDCDGLGWKTTVPAFGLPFVVI